jgi:hypothetical protein
MLGGRGNDGVGGGHCLYQFVFILKTARLQTGGREVNHFRTLKHRTHTHTPWLFSATLNIAFFTLFFQKEIFAKFQQSSKQKCRFWHKKAEQIASE